MAKKSSAHDDDSAPASSRTTRQTRSQSVDSTEPGGRRSNRRGAEDVNNELPTRTRKAKVSKTTAATAPALPYPCGHDLTSIPALGYANHAVELETVAEDVEIDPEEEQAQLEAQLQLDADSDDDNRRRASQQSAVSGISGTTAKTSFSQDELAQMDPDMMIDLLPSLAAASDELAQLLLPNGTDTPIETFKEIRRTGSRKQKLYQNRVAGINLHKPHFGSEEYIRPVLVSRAMLSTEDFKASPDALRRLDAVVFKVNLTQMINALLVTCDSSDWGILSTDALARLARVFPEAITGPAYQTAALQFWLNLAAQLTITELEAYSEANQDFDPEAVINNIFYDEDGDFRQLDALHLGMVAETTLKEAQGYVERLVEELKTPFGKFDGTNATAIIGRLKTTFRWERFREHVMRYYEIRSAQLNEGIAQAGGVRQIAQFLVNERERRLSAKYAEQVKERVKADAAPRKSLGGENPIAILKRREARISKTQAASENQVIVEQPSVEEEEEEEDSLEPLPTSFPSIPTRQVPQLQATKSLLDPQPNARRVSPISEGGESQPRLPSVPVNREYAASPGKRRRVQSEDEVEDALPNPTQDEGFQDDMRDSAAADQRRKRVAFSTKPTFRVRPSSQVSEAGPSTFASATRSSYPSQHARQNPGSSIPAPLPTAESEEGELATSSVFARARLQAQLNRVKSTSTKERRKRYPWTEEEENAVIELIEKHGTGGISYAELKAIDAEVGQRLHRRTQEDIRFKARNMKVTFLKAGTFMPENFEQIFLDKKAMDTLRDRGIPYEQEQQRSTGRYVGSVELDE